LILSGLFLNDFRRSGVNVPAAEAHHRHYQQHQGCADGNGTLTHLFFSDDEFDIARAKAICSDCPVLLECRTWALTKIGGEDRHTILGGLTWSQRKAWLSKYRSSLAATTAIESYP